MNPRVPAFAAVGAAVLVLVGCLLSWLEVSNPSLFRIAIETGAFEERSLRLVKLSVGVLAAMSGYLGWHFAARPLRRYAQLMLALGLATGLIIGIKWPWTGSDFGLQPGAGIWLSASGAFLYVLFSVVALLSLRRTVQP